MMGLGGMFREAFALWRKARQEKSVSLQFRLFAFFALFVFVLASAFTIVLTASGVFGEGRNRYRQWMESELERVSSTAAYEFGRLSLRGSDYAETLARDMEGWLERSGASLENLSERPELLEDLLSAHAAGLVNVMQGNNCTGAFIILNATVNPSLPNARNSRAGMFFKRTEQNPVSAVKSKAFYLRGPARISRETGIEMIGLWQMEFDVSDYWFYEPVLETARQNSRLPVSRLYYWASRVSLDGSREPGMLLCVPLIDSRGTVFGMFGFEMSPMLFKLLYSPDSSRYYHVLTLLAPADGDTLLADSGLVAGNSYVSAPSLGSLRMTTPEGSTPQVFGGGSGNPGGWAGVQTGVKLYPSASPYHELVWRLAVLLPMDDYESEVARSNGLLYAALITVLTVCLALAYLISRRTIRPVLDALRLITSEGGEVADETGGASAGYRRTRIAEIDDLLEFLAAQDERRMALETALESARGTAKDSGGEGGGMTSPDRQAAPDLSSFHEFLRNIETLSRAERAVFDLYMKGHNAKEISDLLSISMNTTKTHNRHIYTKLNVASRKELMVYVQMMGAEGRDGD